MSSIVFAVAVNCAGPAHTAQLPPPTAEQERDLLFYTSILRNPGNDLDTRSGAAERLLRLSLPQAIAVLEEALASGTVEGIVPVSRAMLVIERPEFGLLDAAVSALRTAGPETLDPLVLALRTYDEAALTRVADLALNQQVPPAERLGAIHALGAFPTRDSGDRLMSLADPRRGQPEEIRAAALASLRRLAPADFGSDYSSWRAWWSEVRDKSKEEWARELVRQYQRRHTELELRNRDLADRYVELLRDLYRTLDVTPDQLERLPRDLTDSLTPVRAFAMDRIARLLRDSVLIPNTIRQQLMRSLEDPSPDLRRQAIALLDELDQPELVQTAVARLDTERDPLVVEEYLALLARRPNAVALAALLGYLDHERHAPSAAHALWSLLQKTDVAAEQRAAILVAVRERLAQPTATPTTTPANGNGERHFPDATGHLARILALIGNDEDLTRVEPLLADPAPATRALVAQGLAARGRAEPLLLRADDAAIYPSCLQVLAHGPADLDTFRRLVELTPSEEAVVRWEEAVRAHAGRLDPTLLVEADGLLSGAGAATNRLRVMVLSPAAVLPADALPAEYRIELLVRLTPLLIEQGEALRAFEILDAAGDVTESPDLAEAKFRAALCAARYETASKIHDEPRPWVDLFIELVESGAPAAARLNDEITRRFEGRLEPDVQTAFDTARNQLAPPASPPDEGVEPAPQTRVEGGKDGLPVGPG